VHAAEEIVGNVKRENASLRKALKEVRGENERLASEIIELQANSATMRAQLLEAQMTHSATQRNFQETELRLTKEIENCRACAAKRERITHLQEILERRSKAVQEEEAENAKLKEEITDCKMKHKGAVNLDQYSYLMTWFSCEAAQAKVEPLEHAIADLTTSEARAKSAIQALHSIIHSLSTLSEEDLIKKAPQLACILTCPKEPRQFVEIPTLRLPWLPSKDTRSSRKDHAM